MDKGIPLFNALDQTRFALKPIEKFFGFAK